MYSFSSYPRVLSAKSRRRSGNSKERVALSLGRGLGRYANIMHDRRVLRGNACTMAEAPAPQAARPPRARPRPEPLAPRSLLRKRMFYLRPRTPSPSTLRNCAAWPGLEGMYATHDAPPGEAAEVDTQTDGFVDLPPAPTFLPAKSGIDKEAQVVCEELFDFDFEVKPILEMLVRKILDQSVMEVREEEELASLRARQRVQEELGSQKRAHTERLMERHAQAEQAKAVHVEGMRALLAEERELARKLAASAFALCFFQELQPSALDALRQAGFLFDPTERAVERHFLGGLAARVTAAIKWADFCRSVVDRMLRESVRERLHEPAPLAVQVVESIVEEARPTPGKKSRAAFTM